MSSVPGAQGRRQVLFTKLLAALEMNASKPGSSSNSNSTTVEIDTTDAGVLIDSLNIQGIGLLHLPLSAKDVLRLRNACEYVSGSTIMVKSKHRSAWQLDFPCFGFPRVSSFIAKTVPLIAAEVCKRLGLHGSHVRAQLSKSFLCEHDGFRFLRDSNHFQSLCNTKQQGGIAAMIIPFPTMMGFKGAAMVAADGSNLLRFDFSWNKAGQFSHITFYSSNVQLYVNANTQFFLLFNLFKEDSKNFDHAIPLNCSSSSKPTREKVIQSLTSKTEAVLRPWAHGKLYKQNANNLPNQLAIPLQHKCSKRNLSFDGLEDEDHIVAEVLRNCKNSTQELLLEVYLCTLTLRLTGRKEHDYPNYGYSETESDKSEDDEDDEGEEEEEGEEEGQGIEEEEGEEEVQGKEGEDDGKDEEDEEGEDVDEESDSKSTSSEEDRGHTMAELEEVDLNANYWIGWNDEPVDSMTIASRDIVVRNVDYVWTGCFGKTLYKSRYHTGRQEYYSEEGCLQQWFRKAVIVVQPRTTRSVGASDERDSKRRRRSS